jgi:hypothetical protein
MCFPVKCELCERMTWTGCGQHIESVRNRNAQRARAAQRRWHASGHPVLRLRAAQACRVARFGEAMRQPRARAPRAARARARPARRGERALALTELCADALAGLRWRRAAPAQALKPFGAADRCTCGTGGAPLVRAARRGAARWQRVSWGDLGGAARRADAFLAAHTESGLRQAQVRRRAGRRAAARVRAPLRAPAAADA